MIHQSKRLLSTLFTLIALIIIPAANAAYIDFSSTKDTVSVGELFTVEVVLKDIDQSSSSLEYLTFADYVFTYNADLLVYSDQNIMPDTGLRYFNYLSQQITPPPIGSITTTYFEFLLDSYGISTSDELFQSQILNNPNDYVTIMQIEFEATNAGSAYFDISNSSVGFFGEAEQFDVLNNDFTVEISAPIVQASGPATGIMAILASLLAIRLTKKR